MTVDLGDDFVRHFILLYVYFQHVVVVTPIQSCEEWFLPQRLSIREEMRVGTLPGTACHHQVSFSHSVIYIITHVERYVKVHDIIIADMSIDMFNERYIFNPERSPAYRGSGGQIAAKTRSRKA
jgi:hypothetical protein